MSQVVIVPLSPALFAAWEIPLLVELGRRSDAVFHVVDLRPREVAATPAGDGASEPPWRLRGRTQQSRGSVGRDAYLDSVVRQLAEVLGSGRVRSLVRVGEADDELASYARSTGAGLVVVGIEEREAAGEEAARSRAERLAAASGAPVFLLSRSRERRCGTLLSALDGAEAARAGLELALTAARVAGVEELLVQALPSSSVIPGPRASVPRPIPAPA